MTATAPALQITDLTVAYRVGSDWRDAVRDVSLRIEPGQTYGLVGESGSGKSTLALAVMRYLSDNGQVLRGSIHLAGRDLLALDGADLQQTWRQQLKLVPQNPLSSLNPSLRVGAQLAEAVDGRSQRKVVELLAQVRISDPERVAQSYPHQLSGGMQQRVMIAMALAAEPALIILDEPTTNLDVTTEAVILDLLRDLIRERNTAALYVSHNLGVIARISDRVAVMYAGKVVEDAAVAELFQQPVHPYTRGLLASLPRIGYTKRGDKLQSIPPAPGGRPEQPAGGCLFAPRCSLAVARCTEERPVLELVDVGGQHSVRCHRWREVVAGAVASAPSVEGRRQFASQGASSPTVLDVRDLHKSYGVHQSLRERLRRRGSERRGVRAVDGVSFQIGRARTLGLVGESGSGKTTVARCIVGLATADAGQISLLAAPLAPGLAQRERSVLQHLQMVFQNPEEALNPAMTVGETLSRPLIRLRGMAAREARRAVPELLAAVALDPSYAQRLPAQLSGGEKQRVAIARAFAAQPDLLIFDEAVSALDVSVQAVILNLLTDLQQSEQSAFLFISHDLAVVAYLADEIAVVYLGQIVETGRTEHLLEPPYHPYSEALLSAVPTPDLAAAASGLPGVRLAGDIPSPVNLPTGCRFHTRCPRFLGEICVQQEPPWQEAAAGHRIRCHIPLADLRPIQRSALPADSGGEVPQW